ncbi:flavin-containing monooxygenase FMO GS-OX3-like [Cotesia glomerata]|uniref:Flavin-containing monooxygenase n=1 Tax=Cotesia glomerata TaxID=32391 RepID=A0AAV7JA88_COTGL|nr:flavin-containing monooxygenase FMO GS-OX3-like [Cotesia glomerata]KAH0569046.1 hypothetical protein KQX54_021753 [Cotesia glomerata]
MPSDKKRVAIIGGGVAGLIVARHVSARTEDYSLMLFEQTDQVGGTWVYTDRTEVDKNGLPVHSSMYKNLRTNLPKEIMQIPDFPFKNEDGPSFVHHSVIRQYLQDYAQHFNLFAHIKLNTLVKHVEPVILSDQTTWLVTYKNMATLEETTVRFDAVILCNGHYTVGNIPNIRGRSTFNGTCIHSHQYRLPEKYKGKNVCILGASWSGIDIAIEVSKYAKKVYLSHNLPEGLKAKIANNVEQRAGIEFIDGKTFHFRDGTSAEIDDLIYCTGYKFTYPFMSDKVKIKTDDNHVEPIYKHLVHADTKNLFFMGLPGIVIPFPMFHIQSQYILRILDGHIKLPSSEKMKSDYEKEKNMLLQQGIPIRHIIKMKERQWAYYDEIATAANVASFPPVIKKIYNHSNAMRELDFMTYKNYQYRIIDKEDFTVCYGKQE